METLAEDTNLTLLVVEPNLQELPDSLVRFKNVKLVSVSEALKQAAILALLVNHRGFYDIDHKHLNGKSIIDTCGVWSNSPMSSL